MFKSNRPLSPDNLPSNILEYDNVPCKKSIKIGTHVLSNLPLQVSLYFNLIFFPFWCMVYLFMIPEKLESLSTLYKFILALTLVVINLIEAVRLYIGYKGNLREKIADLAGFWLITFLLQSPLQTFLLFSSGLKTSIIEKIVQMIMCLFLISQLFFGLIAIRNSSKHSTLMFHSSNVRLEDSEDNKNNYKLYFQSIICYLFLIIIYPIYLNYLLINEPTYLHKYLRFFIQIFAGNAIQNWKNVL